MSSEEITDSIDDVPEYKAEIDVKLIPYGNHFMFPVQHRHYYEDKEVNLGNGIEVSTYTNRLEKVKAVAREIVNNPNAEFRFRLQHTNQFSDKRHEMAMEMGFQGYSEALIEQAFQLGCNLKVVFLLDGERSEFVRCGYVETGDSRQYSRLEYNTDFPNKFLIISQDPEDSPYNSFSYNMIARVTDSIDNLE
jgi:hypothetical protein